eukprot:8003684-Pyramimonas_sp.AAC.1
MSNGAADAHLQQLDVGVDLLFSGPLSGGGVPLRPQQIIPARYQVTQSSHRTPGEARRCDTVITHGRKAQSRRFLHYPSARLTISGDSVHK